MDLNYNRGFAKTIKARSRVIPRWDEIVLKDKTN